MAQILCSVLIQPKMKTNLLKAVLQDRFTLTAPAGSLQVSQLPPEVQNAIEEIRALLKNPASDSIAISKALTDHGFGMDADAPMDNPEWAIALVDNNGRKVMFSIGHQCGKPPVQKLTEYLGTQLPSISQEERAALLADIRSDEGR